MLIKLEIIFLSLIVLSSHSCTIESKTVRSMKRNEAPKNVQSKSIQTILDTSNVKGSVLIFDASKNEYHSNDFDWAKEGRLPASTFKIPNSIIGLETGIVLNDSAFFKWDGTPRMMKRWDRDMYFVDAFRLSCLPIYRDLTNQIGLARMKEQLSKLNFGHMIVDSSNLDMFWLTGDSKISQFEQIDFLNRLVNKQLKLKESTYEIMRRIMVVEEAPNYTLRGKTGWSQTDDYNNLWFVGYVEVDNKVYYFATNIEPKNNDDIDRLAVIRLEITMAALKNLGIL